MAFWDKISSRGTVDDRRGMTAGAGLGGLVVVGAVLLFNLFGVEIDPNALQQIAAQLENTSVTTQEQPPEFAGEDDYELFVSRVVGSTNDMWDQIIKDYNAPKIVLFRGVTRSGCGLANSATGPFYCPSDQTIYLDETFFDELKTRLGGDNGDVAQAYVIAHEAGHHAQNLLGLLDGGRSNEESVRTELQADCFAGLWAHAVQKLGVFENSDEVNEAIRTARAVGDDNIQQQSGQAVNPENWTHGSSEQRINAFNTGYTTGDFAQCK